MPRERLLGRYPEAYFDIFRKGAERKFTIPCVTNREALNLRQQLYAFRQSVRKAEAEPLHQRGIKQCVERCRLSVDAKRIICEPKENISGTEILNNALRSSL